MWEQPGAWEHYPQTQYTAEREPKESVKREGMLCVWGGGSVVGL